MNIEQMVDLLKMHENEKYAPIIAKLRKAEELAKCIEQLEQAGCILHPEQLMVHLKDYRAAGETE